MYLSRYLHVSIQLLLAGADDSPHHRREAALNDVMRRLVIIMFRLLIDRSGWLPSSAHRASSIRHPCCRT